jgi:hypothetical protein
MSDIESDVRHGSWIPFGPATPRLQYTAETNGITYAGMIGTLSANGCASESRRLTGRTIEMRVILSEC